MMLLPWVRTSTWSMKRLAQQKLSSDTARVILQDVAGRIEGQMVLLDELESSLTDAGTLKRADGVIVASNQKTANLLDWKGHLEREQHKEKIKRQAKIALRNLEVLHKDTHGLVELEIRLEKF